MALGDKFKKSKINLGRTERGLAVKEEEQLKKRLGSLIKEKSMSFMEFVFSIHETLYSQSF